MCLNGVDGDGQFVFIIRCRYIYIAGVSVRVVSGLFCDPKGSEATAAIGI